MQCHYTCRGLISGGGHFILCPPQPKKWGGSCPPCPPRELHPCMRVMLQPTAPRSTDLTRRDIVRQVGSTGRSSSERRATSTRLGWHQCLLIADDDHDEVVAESLLPILFRSNFPSSALLTHSLLFCGHNNISEMSYLLPRLSCRSFLHCYS